MRSPLLVIDSGGVGKYRHVYHFPQTVCVPCTILDSSKNFQVISSFNLFEI